MLFFKIDDEVSWSHNRINRAKTQQKFKIIQTHLLSFYAIEFNHSTFYILCLRSGRVHDHRRSIFFLGTCHAPCWAISLYWSTFVCHSIIYLYTERRRKCVRKEPKISTLIPGIKIPMEMEIDNGPHTRANLRCKLLFHWWTSIGHLLRRSAQPHGHCHAHIPLNQFCFPSKHREQLILNWLVSVPLNSSVEVFYIVPFCMVC